jgi:hypothetical protein
MSMNNSTGTIGCDSPSHSFIDFHDAKTEVNRQAAITQEVGAEQAREWKAGR